MKYSLIEIKVNSKFQTDRFQVCYDEGDGADRVSKKTYQPSSLGFFYYPKKWKPEKAFNLLKGNMINDRMEMIDSLKKDIEELEKLRLPDWVIKK
jgi:hypothetical protein